MVFMRSKLRRITGFCGNPLTRLRAAPGTSSSQDSRRIPALRPFREPDSAEYRDSQPHKERGIRCNQRRAKLSVVPSGRDRSHEIHADRKQPPHEEARCQREVCRSRPDKGRGHQQRYWTSAGQSERGRQHAQRHRRPPARRARQAARNPPNQPARTCRRYWPPRRSNRRSKNNALNTPTTIRTRANIHSAHTPLTTPYNRLTAACVSSIEAISPGCASGGSGGISGTTHCGCPPARE